MREEKEGNQTAKGMVLKGHTWSSLNLGLVVNTNFASYLMGLDFSPKITPLFPLLGLDLAHLKYVSGPFLKIGVHITVKKNLHVAVVCV